MGYLPDGLPEKIHLRESQMRADVSYVRQRRKSRPDQNVKSVQTCGSALRTIKSQGINRAGLSMMTEDDLHAALLLELE